MSMLCLGVVSVYLAKERDEKPPLYNQFTNYTSDRHGKFLGPKIGPPYQPQFASCAPGSKFYPFTKPGLSNMWSEMEEAHNLRGQLIIMLYLRLLSA